MNNHLPTTLRDEQGREWPILSIDFGGDPLDVADLERPLREVVNITLAGKPADVE